MSCFKLPYSIVHDINRLMASYWSGDKGSKKRIHWMKWDDLCIPEADGGLGFKDAVCFNSALLAKQWWHVIHNEELLSFKVLHAKYCPSSRAVDATKGGHYSYISSGLSIVEEIVDEGVFWRVGDGKSINVWKDKWVVSPCSLKLRVQRLNLLHFQLISLFCEGPKL
ncbi:hypothetical protein PTKIN_Ptkin08bG0094200 [Pterospermum kingtungense]